MTTSADCADTQHEKLYQSAFDNAAVGIAILDMDGTRIEVNKKLCQIMGKDREDLLHTNIWDDTYLDDVAEGVACFKKITDGETESYEREKRSVRPDGGVAWVKVTGSLCDATDGSDPMLIMVVEDVDHQKKSDMARTLLNAEVSHRTKNLLGVIQGIIRRLERNAPSAAELAEAIRQRIFALSASYGILSKTEWAQPNLRDVINEVTLGTFGKFSERIHLDMERIEVAPQVAVNLGLTFYEMIANAAQHGALSCPKGEVHVSASIVHADDAPLLKIVWQERNGPEVRPPDTKGFGLFMLEKGVTTGMSGTCDLDFSKTGLVVELALPIPEPNDGLTRSKTHGAH